MSAARQKVKTRVPQKGGRGLPVPSTGPFSKQPSRSSSGVTGATKVSANSVSAPPRVKSPRPYTYRNGLIISACGCLGVVIYAGVVLFKPPVIEEEYASDDLVREFIKDTDVSVQDEEIRGISFSDSIPLSGSARQKPQTLTLFPEQEAPQPVSSLDSSLAKLRSQKLERLEPVKRDEKSKRPISVEREQKMEGNSDSALTAIWTHKISFIAGLIAVHRPTLPRSGELSKDIVELSLRAGVDPFLTAAIISVESGFQPFARSNKGATGLMQLLPGTARDVYEAKTGRDADPKLTDPRTNIVLGISYIKQLDTQFKGNKRLSLAAYNWGPGNVSDAVGGRKRIPKSVIDYAKMVLDRAVRWRKQFDDATHSASALAHDLR